METRVPPHSRSIGLYQPGILLVLNTYIQRVTHTYEYGRPIQLEGHILNPEGAYRT